MVKKKNGPRKASHARPKPGLKNGPSTKALRISRRIKAYLKEAFGERIDEVILYGSQARGEATKDSDIDVAIITDDELDQMVIDRSLEDLLFEFMLNDGELVTIVALKRSIYDGYSSPLIRNIKREGIVA